MTIVRTMVWEKHAGEWRLVLDQSSFTGKSRTRGDLSHRVGGSQLRLG